MRLPSQLEALHKIIRILERNEIDYMLIGGWALPAYGQIRSTIDIDFAIATKPSKKFERLILDLHNNNYQIPATPKPEDAVIYIQDQENVTGIELWQRPDGIRFNKELLERRLKRKVRDVSFWIIGPEDFIVNKLARVDRSPRDEEDVITVLTNQKGKLDRKYLRRRALESDVWNLISVLESRIKE